MMTGELINVLNLLKSEGITAIPYKGPVLASMAYGNIGLREFGDLDVLINKSDAFAARNILISQQYELDSTINVEHTTYMKLDSEYRFLNKINGVKIEINWSLEGLFFSFGNNPNFLFKDLKIHDINGLNFNTFSSVNQLIMLCIHCAKHDWSILFWICDISEFIKSHENINWHETLKRAEELSVKRILLINLFLAKNILGLDLPDEVLSHLNNDSSIRIISFQIKKRIFSHDESLTIFKKFFLDLKKRDLLIYGIKDCIKGLTSPTYADYEDIPLPKSLFYLYNIIRPILLLKRYGNDSL